MKLFRMRAILFIFLVVLVQWKTAGASTSSLRLPKSFQDCRRKPRRATAQHDSQVQVALLETREDDRPENWATSAGTSPAPLYRPRRLLDARAVMCYLLCGSRLFQQSMRNTLTNVIIYMARDMEISVQAKGSLLAAIATGYFFTQIPGGALADRIGAKNVMTASLALSALCCLAVPAAGDALGLQGIWLAMATMGAVQGPMFPTSSVFLSRWMPPSTEPGQPDEKAWGSSMLDIGISIGSLLIIPVVTSLAEAVGWKGTFWCVGAASLGFVALWVWLAASTPQECWFISDDELEYLERCVSNNSSNGSSHNNKRNRGPEGDPTVPATTWIGMPWKMAFHHGIWAIYFCHIAFNFGAYFLTNWSPTYYKEVLHLEPVDAKLHLMCPHMTNLLVRCFNPTLLAAVAGAGVPLLHSRRLFTVVGYLAAAAFLAPVYRLRNFGNPWVSTLLFSLANAFFGVAPTGFKSNYLDVTERYVGAVAGYGNTLGTVASIVGPRVTAATLDYTAGNWYAVLFTVCAVNVLAAANYAKNAVVAPVEKQLEKDEMVHQHL